MRLGGWSVLLALGVGEEFVPPGPSYQLTANSCSYQPGRVGNATSAVPSSHKAQPSDSLIALAISCLAVSPGSAVSSVPAARPPRLPPPMTIARLQYDGGGDWYANPSSLP